MTIAIMNYVWEHSKSKGLTRLVLLAIADNANEQGDAFPGITRIAKKCNASERSVQNAISELENAGELMVFPQVGMKTISGRTNLYRVVMDGVKAELPRNEHGEIVTARQPKQVKKRSFPDGVQPASPLQGVQTASPHGVQLDSPDGVQPVSPKPSAFPQLNSSTPKPPKGAGKSKAYPSGYVLAKWTDELIAQFSDEYSDGLTALLSASGLVEMYPTIKNMPRRDAVKYIEALRELTRLGCPPAQFESLWVYTRTMLNWRRNAPTPLDMVDQYTAWRQSRNPQLTTNERAERDKRLLAANGLKEIVNG